MFQPSERTIRVNSNESAHIAFAVEGQILILFLFLFLLFWFLYFIVCFKKKNSKWKIINYKLMKVLDGIVKIFTL